MNERRERDEGGRRGSTEEEEEELRKKGRGNEKKNEENKWPSQFSSPRAWVANTRSFESLTKRLQQRLHAET